MIWYLLYPIRGTTDAPVLSPTHPLHDIFARYGRYAARHVVATLLVSVVVATILLYPIPFLFTNDFINGASNLPHHVWTVAQPLPHDAAGEPDVIMRSIWVHGTYMEALNKSLLSSALDLQDELLGITKNFNPASARGLARTADDSHRDLPSLSHRDAMHVANGLTNQSWFFHSPLLYWACSHERLSADDDILSTINDKKNQSTSANVTLRHSMVFSGKRFKDRRLLAADALVITLHHLRDSPVGRLWEERARELPRKAGPDWDIWPPDGRPGSSRRYEFQFRPMSIQDMASLVVAYGLTIVYFLTSVSKLMAVKSKFGLMLTIAAQIAFSTMSSFTICAVFNVNLSHIPRAAYPLVILAMSLEQIFRLINAVMLNPSEDSVSNRIGHAFGQTAHTALTSSTQNVIILAALSRAVSPGVSEFCIFVAVAIVFDFFYLSTFFLSVLSVDVRRMELGDALAKASMRHNRGKSDNRKLRWWRHQVLRGQIALSTRVAGTVVMSSFILIAQWHFFADESLFGKILRLYRGPEPNQLRAEPRSSFLQGIHQARSPTSWLRMQDHDTAREVISIIKPPTSYSYVAQVFDPIVFVRKGSDRVPHTKEPTLLPAAYDFVHHEMARLVFIIVVVVAALRLLMNFLLWEDDGSFKSESDSDDAPHLTVKSLARGHRMDITMMTSSADGLVVSASLDGIIRVWCIRGLGTSYMIANGAEAAATLYPVISMAIDGESKWLALLSRPKKATQPMVFFWDLAKKVWGPSVPAPGGHHRPIAFAFDPTASRDEPRVIAVYQDGSLADIRAGSSRESESVGVFPTYLTCARVGARKGAAAYPRAACKLPTIAASSPLTPALLASNGAPSQPLILSISKHGEVCMATRQETSWESQHVAVEGLGESSSHYIESLPMLDLFVVSGPRCVYLISAEDGSVLYALQTERMRPRPLRCAYTWQRPVQPGPVGLTSFTLGYVETDSGDCILQTFVPAEGCNAIHLHTPADEHRSDWSTWESARQTRKRVTNPGAWDMVSDGSAVGIRQKRPSSKNTQVGDLSGMRKRHSKRPAAADPFEGWEVWTASAGTRLDADESQRLIKNGEQADHLLITELGPSMRVGQNSVAFAFGDMVKLVVLGGQVRVKDAADDANGDLFINACARRRRHGSGSRRRSSAGVQDHGGR
ncbi:hypothetical protein RJ55_07032 [Drechmeria coniospora]|nr:hypothetical protein RJ55_07032 [Drechmeria coniospora]